MYLFCVLPKLMSASLPAAHIVVCKIIGNVRIHVCKIWAYVRQVCRWELAKNGSDFGGSSRNGTVLPPFGVDASNKQTVMT